MITWCNSSSITIKSDIEPSVSVRMPSKNDTEEEIINKREKPYINNERILFDVKYKGKSICFVIPKGFKYDGASIPFGFRWIIGAKGSDEFMVAALVHDWLCEHHACIANNRLLSSIIFRELLLASHVGKVRAYTMFYAVDNFQRLFGNWEK